MSILILVFWGVLINLVIWGAIQGWVYLLPEDQQKLPPEPMPADRPGISILKPLKGLEVGLRENLESVFELNYPAFELLINVAEANDPAIPIVKELIKKYPDVDAHLTVGEVPIGYNPKVNNLILSYEKAKYDWQLILDSNIRVYPEYLNFLAASMTPEAGCISTVFVGSGSRGFGGRLERVFLNTMNSRWMVFSARIGKGFVVGKSMLFKKSVFDEFGGLRYLGGFLAEDMIAGHKTVEVGRTVVVPRVRIYQHLGKLGFRSYWARHVRWARIRKAGVGHVFYSEPVVSCMISGLMMSAAVSYLFEVPPWMPLVAHWGIWSAAEFLFMKGLDRTTSLLDLGAWFIQEILAIPLWLHSLSSRTVYWRGNALILKKGAAVISKEAHAQTPEELAEDVNL